MNKLNDVRLGNEQLDSLLFDDWLFPGMEVNYRPVTVLLTPRIARQTHTLDLTNFLAIFHLNLNTE